MIDHPDADDDATARQTQAITEVLQRTADTDWAPGTRLVAWVVVADWVDAEGERHLSRLAPDEQPAWVNDGLLQAGLDDGWQR